MKFKFSILNRKYELSILTYILFMTRHINGRTWYRRRKNAPATCKIYHDHKNRRLDVFTTSLGCHMNDVYWTSKQTYVDVGKSTTRRLLLTLCLRRYYILVNRVTRKKQCCSKVVKQCCEADFHATLHTCCATSRSRSRSHNHKTTFPRRLYDALCGFSMFWDISFMSQWLR